MKREFQEWYGRVINQQLADSVCEEVDMRLSKMKPLSALWAIDTAKYFMAYHKWVFSCWYFGNTTISVLEELELTSTAICVVVVIKLMHML